MTTMAMPETIPAWTRYRKVKVIGSGASGSVFLVETPVPLAPSIPAGQYVVKRICIASSPDVLKSAATEVKILEQLEPHDNLVRYYEHFFDDEGMINIVIEHCAGGDLETYVKRRVEQEAPLSACEIVYFAFQLFVAVQHLHAHGVLHRDLKPANVLLVERPRQGEDGGGEDGMVDSGRRCTLKVSDFGISRVLERTASVAKTVVGTPFYIAPELCNGETYTNAADMWSLGCIVYELASGGQRCFGGDTLLAVVRSVCAGTIPTLQRAALRPIVLPMVTPLLQLDASKRFTAKDCLRAFFLPDEGDVHYEDDFLDPDDIVM